jgi:hypothetical protein
MDDARSGLTKDEHREHVEHSSCPKAQRLLQPCSEKRERREGPKRLGRDLTPMIWRVL